MMQLVRMLSMVTCRVWWGCDRKCLPSSGSRGNAIAVGISWTGSWCWLSRWGLAWVWNAKELCAHHSFYCWAIYAQGGVIRVELPGVKLFFILPVLGDLGLFKSGSGQPQELRSEHWGLFGYQTWQERKLNKKETQNSTWCNKRTGSMTWRQIKEYK